MQQRMVVTYLLVVLWIVVQVTFFSVQSTASGTVLHRFSRPLQRHVLAATTCPQTGNDHGSVVTSIQVPVSGTYVVWSRMITHGTSANAYWLQIDSGCRIVVGDGALPEDTFAWVNYRDGVESNVIRVQLSAGSHTLALIGKEVGVGVDTVLLTTDSQCTPQGLTPCIGPTITIAPTIIGGKTQLTLPLGLHGIGTGGDNANPASTGTMSPLHQQRTVIVTVFNSQNVQVAQVPGQVSFVSQTGKFTGTLSLPTTISSGVYTMRVRVDGYLQKVVPGIISIAVGQIVILPQVTLTTGDTNADNMLSVLDYNILLDCYSDLSVARNCSTPAKQQAADITDDGRVNEFDYNLFLRELSTQGGQ